MVIIFPSLEWDVGISGGVLQFPADVPGLLDLWWEDETPPLNFSWVYKVISALPQYNNEQLQGSGPASGLRPLS